MTNKTLFFTIIASALMIVLAIFFVSGKDLPLSKPAYQKEVAALLHDPDSAQFRNLIETGGGDVFCGEVRGQNAFGGMGAWITFLTYRQANGVWGVDMGNDYSCDYTSTLDVLRELLDRSLEDMNR